METGDENRTLATKRAAEYRAERKGVGYGLWPQQVQDGCPVASTAAVNRVRTCLCSPASGL